ncbi:MAG: hypothetical protein WCG27_13450, partial [Pseudomonadota bacterium]
VESKAQKEQDLRQKMESANRDYERKMAELKQSLVASSQEINNLKQSHQQILQNIKQEMNGLKQGQLQALNNVKKEQDYRFQLEQANQLYDGKLQQLNQELQTANNNLAKANADLMGIKSNNTDVNNLKQKIASDQKALQDKIASLSAEKESLEKSLKAGLQNQSQRRNVAQKIKESFERAGIDAEVNLGTGEVAFNFGKEYFDYDSSVLKPGMKKVLDHMIPIYAKSIFDDEVISKKIKSVELVGFASPTYRGKLVDPDSMNANGRKAVNYNMDLSFRRSKAIFSYIFREGAIKQTYQRKLFTLSKVSGKSYLSIPPLKSGRMPASINVRKNFCQYYDCSQSQKVIIKFDLAD